MNKHFGRRNINFIEVKDNIIKKIKGGKCNHTSYTDETFCLEQGMTIEVCKKEFDYRKGFNCNNPIYDVDR